MLCQRARWLLIRASAHKCFGVYVLRARLRIDIRDLRLSSAPLIDPSSTQLKETTSKILDRDNGEKSHMPTGCAVGGTIHDDSRGRCVAMSKHLCGVATDLALRCLRNAATDTVATNGPHAGVGISTEQCAPCAAVAQSSTQEPETLHSTAIPAVPARRPAVRVEGVAIALCCHHCMIWSVSLPSYHMMTERRTALRASVSRAKESEHCDCRTTLGDSISKKYLASEKMVSRRSARRRVGALIELRAAALGRAMPAAALTVRSQDWSPNSRRAYLQSCQSLGLPDSTRG